MHQSHSLVTPSEATGKNTVFPYKNYQKEVMVPFAVYFYSLTDDFYADIREDLIIKFDTSEYQLDQIQLYQLSQETLRVC